MTITAHLSLQLTQEALDGGAHEQIHGVLTDTRAFDGCLGVEVIVDVEDPKHVVVVERWASLEHDDAYRAWRATPAGQSPLGSMLAAPPVLTRFTTAEGV